MYQVGSGAWGRVFAVPSEVADKHLKLCGAVSLKVLLLLLRHGEPMDSGKLAALLGQSPADIQDAVNYWVEHGIISQVDEPSVHAASTSSSVRTAPEPSVPVSSAHTASVALERLEELPHGNKIIQLGRRRRLSMAEVNELVACDKGMRGLLGEAQSALARPLKPMETESIATIYAQYELMPDIILMILHYCISIGKTSVTQIEKMAADWYSRDINTHEKAEQELFRLGEKSELDDTIRQTFGIYGRGISDKERVFFKRWTDELRMSTQLIRLAHERTIDMKGKLSFAYINAILDNWHKKGIKTPDAALLDIKDGSPKSKEKAGEPQASYDLGRFGEMVSSGNIWE